MKIVLVAAMVYMTLMSGCASLFDAKYVQNDGKSNAFVPERNPYEPPRDPLAR
ncbi:MAG: hypothetical protein V2B18_21605 [Pseudomonadota bacterium]